MKRREFLKFSAAASAVVAAGLQSECASTCKGEEESTFKIVNDYGELYCSPEVMKDIKNWGVDCIDEYTRKEILTNRR